MNDFFELENELRKLRPARPSPILFERVEEAMAENWRAPAAADARPMAKFWHFTEVPHKVALGFGLAAAAVLLLFATIRMERQQAQSERIAQISTAPETKPVPSGVEGATAFNQFIPAGATQVVYNTRDEGLQFADASERPLRRLRYQTHQMWQWRNPKSGASLRVSYPSDEVVLIPVSGQ
jgi:hypothetical protein